jgi:hypothetical protein
LFFHLHKSVGFNRLPSVPEKLPVKIEKQTDITTFFLYFHNYFNLFEIRRFTGIEPIRGRGAFSRPVEKPPDLGHTNKAITAQAV